MRPLSAEAQRATIVMAASGRLGSLGGGGGAAMPACMAGASVEAIWRARLASESLSAASAMGSTSSEIPSREGGGAKEVSWPQHMGLGEHGCGRLAHPLASSGPDGRGSTRCSSAGLGGYTSTIQTRGSSPPMSSRRAPGGRCLCAMLLYALNRI